MAKRLKELKARRGRFHVLKKCKLDVARIVRIGGVLALTYGQETMGVSPTTLLAQRRAIASTLVTEGSGDLDLRLALADGRGKAKVDPAFAAHVAPIGAWAEAAWCYWLPLGTLRELMRKTCDRFPAGVRWATVRGPAAACYASAMRLGWSFTNAFEVVTDVGQRLHFLRDSPAFVKLRVVEAVDRWRARAIEDKFPSLCSGGRGDGPHLLPILQLLSDVSRGEEWTWQHRGALKSAVSGRQWSQQGLYKAGLVGSMTCQLCVATHQCSPDSEDPAHCGTLVHRTCTCPALEEFRAKAMPSSVKASLQKSILADGSVDPQKFLWFTRALRRSPLCKVPARDQEESFEWVKQPDGGLLEGDVYTDGSLMDNEPEFEGRCKALGWSFVVLGPDGRVRAAARGCPPAYIDTIYGAELWAVQMVVIRAFAGMARVITDCESVRVGCQSGSKRTTGPGSVYARTWAAVHATGDEGELEVPVVWMPAHTALWQIDTAVKSDGTFLSALDRDANDLADKGAKVAASSRRVAEAVRASLLEEASEVADMARWIARVTVQANHFDVGDGSFVRDSQADCVRGRQASKRGRKRKAELVAAEGSMTERLLKAPRLVALRARIQARSAG